MPIELNGIEWNGRIKVEQNESQSLQCYSLSIPSSPPYFKVWLENYWVIKVQLTLGIKFKFREESIFSTFHFIPSNNCINGNVLFHIIPLLWFQSFSLLLVILTSQTDLCIQKRYSHNWPDTKYSVERSSLCCIQSIWMHLNGYKKRRRWWKKKEIKCKEMMKLSEIIILLMILSKKQIDCERKKLFTNCPHNINTWVYLVIEWPM